MRIYQGVDLVEVGRLRETYERREAFGREIFTEAESSYCLARPDPYPHFAARFAVKEACLKAFGVGMGGLGLGATGRLREIEVEPTPSGKPTLRFHGSVEQMSRRRRIRQATVSISHAGGFAVATVVLLGEEGPPEEGDA